MITKPLTTISSHELNLMEAARSLDIRETLGHAIHLHLHGGRHRWLVQTSHGQLEFSADSDNLRPDLDLTLRLSDRLSWCSDLIHFEERDLRLADSSTAVLSDGELAVAIDLVPGPTEAPEAWPVRYLASATLPLYRFGRALSSARVMPSGADDQRHPLPPMWLNLANGRLNLHIDWGDFLRSRATYTVSVDARKGTGTICLPHRRVDDFLRRVLMHVDDEQPLTVAIGEMFRFGERLPTVSLACDGWRFTVVARDALSERWTDRVEDELRGFDITDRDSTKWLVKVAHRPIHVTLHSGHPDMVRVSAPLISGVDDTTELLREISTLNGASTDVRYWFEDDTAWVGVDVPCTRLEDVGSAVRSVSLAVDTYGPLLSAWG